MLIIYVENTVLLLFLFSLSYNTNIFIPHCTLFEHFIISLVFYTKEQAWKFITIYLYSEFKILLLRINLYRTDNIKTW